MTWDTDPDPLIVETPPLLCVEIVSRLDSLTELQERVDDYKQMGVHQVWVIDPFRKKAYMASERGFLQPEADALVVEGTAVRVPLAEMFAALRSRAKS